MRPLKRLDITDHERCCIELKTKRELALACWSAKAAGIPEKNYHPASFLR